VAQGDIAVGSECVGVVILPGTGGIGVADPVSGRVEGSGFGMTFSRWYVEPGAAVMAVSGR